MGREIKRVPLDFDWPLGEIWPGFTFSLCSNMDRYFEKLNRGERCNLCRYYAHLMEFAIADYGCPIVSFQQPPNGDGYQLWETTSEGSPMSPVFKMPNELAKWLVDNKISACGSMTCTYDEWLKFIKKSGRAPTMIWVNGRLKSGVAAFGD
jgi:hypothetical protein